jgi:hypothetical protein
MQNTLSIRYAFCACAYGVLCYLELSVVFKAKVARHVRIVIKTKKSFNFVVKIKLQGIFEIFL